MTKTMDQILRDELKDKLRNWMAMTNIMAKTYGDPKPSNSDIAYWWRATFNIKMNEAWVSKHLKNR